MGIYIGLGILGLAMIGCGVGAILLSRATRKRNRELAEKQAQLEDLKAEGTKMRHHADELYESRLKEFDEQIQEKLKEIENLGLIIDNRQHDLQELNEKVKASGEDYIGGQEKIQDMADELNGLYQKKENLINEVNDMVKNVQLSAMEKKSLVAEVSDLKERKRLAILNLEQNDAQLGDLEISERDIKLINILRQIELDYPDFAAELATIEGRKVGLPQLQTLASEYGLNGQSGIYRLVLKSDKEISYVGQAVDIKNRGYEHVKKMIGVDAKGSEKLYKYRPEDFYGTVVERDPKDLDEAERYGIEFFGCKEKGLNKK